MKKQIFKLFAIGVITLAMFSSCNKDTSQEDIIVNQQLINVAVRIVDASDNENPLDSAVVEIISGATLLSATTDGSGLAYFTGVAISDNTPVTVKKTGYATVITEMDLLAYDYRQTQVSNKIALYPTNGANMVTVTGNLTIESNVTNREREAVPVGTVVRAYNNNMSTRIAFVGATDANGDYTIKVPVGYKGNDQINVVCPEIYTNQTIAVKNDDDYSIAVMDRMTFFKLGTSALSGAVKSVPSVYAAIPAPAAATIGSGFSLSSVAKPTTLTPYSEPVLISGGSGYTNGNNQLINLSSDSKGNAAQLQVDVVNGSIVNIDGFVDNNAKYTAAPTFSTSVLGGNGAEIEIQFVGTFKIIIANNGSNYVTFPDVAYTYKYYLGNILTEYSSDLTLSNYTDLAGEKIVNEDFNNADTITIWHGLASAPVFTVVNPSTEQMYISFDSSNISTTGKITGHNDEEIGYGYDVANPPAISLVAVAGYGSGAILKANLSSDGKLSSISIADPGMGYVKNVNDFRGDGTNSNSSENPSYSTNDYDAFSSIINATPGATYERSAFYGTGTPRDEF